MSRHALSRTPVIVVAVLALVVAAVGTATAGYAAATITKAQVKKIAKKQAGKAIKKAAPTLSVGSAANAANLDSKPASTYLDRVAFTSFPVGGPAVPFAGGSTTVEVIAPLSLTVPAGVSFVKTTATATVSGTTTYVYWVEQDAACGTTSPHANDRLFGSSNGQDSMTVSFVFPVTPGAHVYRLCGAGSTGTSTVVRSLSAETVATGATGGSTIAKPARPGVVKDLDGDVTTLR